MSSNYVYSQRSIILIGWIFLSGIVQGQTSNISTIWANEGSDKVTQDELRASSDSSSVFNSVWDGTKIILFGGKNEVIAFNLILEASISTANHITVSFDTLTGPAGSVISAMPSRGDNVFNWVNHNIELFYIRYLEIKGISTDLFFNGYNYDERHIPKRFRRPWTGDGEGSGSWQDRPDHNKFYPEIAIPLELMSGFNITAGQNQSIWVDIYIPKSVSAGTYVGTISVWENDTPSHQIPVELSVHNFVLPDLPSAKTMLFLGYEDINMRYLGEEEPIEGSANDIASRLIRDRHFLLAHRHRISLIDGNMRSTAQDNEGDPIDQPHPQWLPRLDGTLFTASNGYNGPGVGIGNNVYSIGTYGDWSWQGEGEPAMRNHTDAWVNWFDSNAVNTEYFLYLIDESENFSEIEQWAQWINSNPGPGQKLLSMATMTFPTATTNTPALDIPTSWFSTGINSTWQNAIDSYKMNTAKRVFFYNSNRPGSGSFAIEDDGVALRELAWGQYKKGIDRWFYWESTYYNNFQGNTGQTNVFQTAQTFGDYDGIDNSFGETGWNYLNGDGVLFYPGTDTHYPGDSYNVKGPFASTRLKQWRRGIQDVDYLTMAAAINPVRVQQIVDSMVPKVLWEIGVSDVTDPTWVLTDISWPIDPDDWEEVRAELADIIEVSATDVTSMNNPNADNFYLSQNYPNPFNPETTIRYQLPKPTEVRMEIYNVLGELVRTLVDQKQTQGYYTVQWNGMDQQGRFLVCGVYFYTLRTKDFVKTRKLLLIQ